MDLRRRNGQASVELVLAIPLMAIVLLAGLQLVVAGHAWWKLQESARLAARERYVAEQRGALDGGKRRALRVGSALLGDSRQIRFSSDGSVLVSAKIPLIEPFRSAIGDAGVPRLTARSAMLP